jgi:hypothetical protein
VNKINLIISLAGFAGLSVLHGGAFAANNESAMNVKTKLSSLTEIELKVGVNDVELFAAAGEATDRDILLYGNNASAPFHHPGKIIVLSRETLGAWGGYLVYEVVLPGIDNPDAWDVLPRDYFDHKDKGGDSFTDEPSGNLRAEVLVKTIRFFNGTWEGQKATLLVMAKRELPPDLQRTGIDRPGAVHISVYELRASDLRAPGVLTRVADVFTAKKYCNADMALQRELGLPLPPSYPGMMSQDGCDKGEIPR